jgi:uncharacterized protein YndB with AHSA1/START domain
VAPMVSIIDIARSPDEVFAYVTDPARFAEWQADVVAAHLEGDGPPTVGSRIVQTRRIGRAEWTQTQEITTLSPPRRWAARGLDGPIRASADITVEPLENGAGARATFALDFDGPGLGRLLLPQVRRIAAKQAPRSYQRLKERLERPFEGSRS